MMSPSSAKLAETMELVSEKASLMLMGLSPPDKGDKR